MSDAMTLDLADGVYDTDSSWRGMVMVEREMGAMGLVAGGFPVKPPAQWFGNPNLQQLSPLVITADGYVSGHIAAWHTSHIGMAGGVKPPRSKSNYAYFRTGAVECDDGSFVDVGQITLAGGHASLEASVRDAVAHYDNTNSAVMDVAAGEDKHGIWVSGALRPDITDSQIRAVRASSVSGDWRPINGRLELVAVCSVNCPGFPIPRARVASGSPIALVAAGVEPIIEEVVRQHAAFDIEAGIKDGLSSFRDRILRLETAVLADSGGPSPAATEVSDELRQRVHGARIEAEAAHLVELRSRVHGVTETESEPTEDSSGAIAELRRRVRPEAAIDSGVDTDTTWTDGLDIAVPIAAALRARVHSGSDAVPFDRAVTAAALRERVHGLTASAPYFQGMVRGWDAVLHPRGRDGKFIEKGGFVSGTFRMVHQSWMPDHPLGNDVSNETREMTSAKVLGFRKFGNETYVLVDTPDTQADNGIMGMAKASDVVEAPAVKAERGYWPDDAAHAAEAKRRRPDALHEAFGNSMSKATDQALKRGY